MALESAWVGATPSAAAASGMASRSATAARDVGGAQGRPHVPPSAVDFQGSHGKHGGGAVERPYQGDWVQPGVGGTVGNPATVLRAQQPPPLQTSLAGPPPVATHHFDVPPRRGSVSPRGSPPGTGFGAPSGSMVDAVTPRYMQTMDVAAKVGKFAALSANYDVPVSVRRKQAAELRACLMRIDRILDEPESHVQP